jgi:hypothetical protein
MISIDNHTASVMNKLVVICQLIVYYHAEILVAIRQSYCCLPNRTNQNCVIPTMTNHIVALTNVHAFKYCRPSAQCLVVNAPSQHQDSIHPSTTQSQPDIPSQILISSAVELLITFALVILKKPDLSACLK